METLVFNLDSRSRNINLYPSNSEFRYSFSDYGPILKNVIELKISSIEFPNTSHTMNSEKYDNCSMTINNEKKTIPNGNYNSNDLMKQIENILPENCTAVVNLQSALITIKNDGDTNIELVFGNSTDYFSLGQLLGFKKLNYIINANDKIESECVINSIGDQYYFLKLNDYGKVNMNGRKYMAKILMLTPKYEMTYESQHTFVSKDYKFKQPTNINHLDICIHDYLGNTVELNGCEWSFTLEVNIINNSVLKKYHELSFYSGELLELMLHDNMLEFYDRENKESEESKTLFNNSKVNNPMLMQMNNNNVELQQKLMSNVNMKNVKGNLNDDSFSKFSYD